MEIVEIKKTPKTWILYFIIWVLSIVGQFFCEIENYSDTENYCLSYTINMSKGII